jgi:hypothetical protein
MGASAPFNKGKIMSEMTILPKKPAIRKRDIKYLMEKMEIIERQNNLIIELLSKAEEEKED